MERLNFNEFFLGRKVLLGVYKESYGWRRFFKLLWWKAILNRIEWEKNVFPDVNFLIK